MKKNWKKVLVGTLCLVGFLLLLVKVNQFEKVPLISTEGQSYEKAVVTKITKDNLAEDGERYGTQEVRVQVKSGAYAGEEFDAVNPSGSLFGMENCEVGSRVIVIVSSTDDNAVVTVYSKDRTMAIYLFVLFFLSGDMYDRWKKRSQSHCKSGIYRCVYCLSDVSADVPGHFTDRYYHCCCHSLDIADPVAFGRSL